VPLCRAARLERELNTQTCCACEYQSLFVLGLTLCVEECVVVVVVMLLRSVHLLFTDRSLSTSTRVVCCCVLLLQNNPTLYQSIVMQFTSLLTTKKLTIVPCSLEHINAFACTSDVHVNLTMARQQFGAPAFAKMHDSPAFTR
jgi:hypothetical protein